MTRSTAQPKQPVRFSFAASNTRRTEPISKIVAPTNAVMPPPYSISVPNSVDGWTKGRNTKNALITHTTLPSVNIVATSYDTSQTGNLVNIRRIPRAISRSELVGRGVRYLVSAGEFARLTASACRPLRLFRDVHLYVMVEAGCSFSDLGLAGLGGRTFSLEDSEGALWCASSEEVGWKCALVGFKKGNGPVTRAGLRRREWWWRKGSRSRWKFRLRLRGAGGGMGLSAASFCCIAAN